MLKEQKSIDPIEVLRFNNGYLMAALALAWDLASMRDIAAFCVSNRIDSISDVGFGTGSFFLKRLSELLDEGGDKIFKKEKLIGIDPNGYIKSDEGYCYVQKPIEDVSGTFEVIASTAFISQGCLGYFDDVKFDTKEMNVKALFFVAKMKSLLNPKNSNSLLIVEAHADEIVPIAAHQLPEIGLELVAKASSQNISEASEHWVRELNWSLGVDGSYYDLLVCRPSKI